MRLHKMLSRLVLLVGLAGLTSLTASASDLHVGASQTYATLTAAHTAAVAGDRIIVHDGTYDEASVGIDGFHWDKDVDFVAAPGENPVMTCTPPDFSYEMFVLGGTFTPASVRTWDGIDIKISKYWYTQGEISMGTYTGTVTFKNMQIFDTGAVVTSAAAMFNLPGSTKLNLENVTIDCAQTPISGLLIDTGLNIVKISDCSFIGRINAAINVRTAFGHRVDITNTTFTETRTPYNPSARFLSQATGSITATDCRFILKTPWLGAGSTPTIYDSYTQTPGTSGPTSTTLTRCLLDTRLGGQWAVTLGSTENGSNFKAVNCLFPDDSQVGPVANGRSPGTIRNLDASGNTTAQFDHCSFSNINTTDSLRSIQVSGANVNTFNLILRNNVFDIPGSTRGVVSTSTVDGTLAGTVNITAGTNLRWTNGATVGVREKLTGGTIISGDPNFAADLVHLEDPSAAVNVGANLGITDDYDHDARPLPVGSLPDLGADESYLVPVELSQFGLE